MNPVYVSGISVSTVPVRVFDLFPVINRLPDTSFWFLCGQCGVIGRQRFFDWLKISQMCSK